MMKIFDRFREPSTWAGVGIFATLGASLFPAHALALQAVAGAAAGLAALLREGA